MQFIISARQLFVLNPLFTTNIIDIYASLVFYIIAKKSRLLLNVKPSLKTLIYKYKNFSRVSSIEQLLHLSDEY